MSRVSSLESAFNALSEHYVLIGKRSTTILEELSVALGRCGKQIVELKREHESHRKETKSRFNVFTVLRSSSDETSFHSKWLAHLLNPVEGHDCESLFLRLFIETLKRGVQTHLGGDDELLECLNTFVFENVKVRMEVPVEDGRIDIWIDSPGWGVIAIENKIFAREQPKQLSTYWRHLSKTSEPKKRHILLLYLTLDGKASETAEPYTNCYYRVSYRRHIRQWIEECMKVTTEHVGIQKAFEQYHRIIETLTGTDSVLMKAIIELLKQHPEIVEHLRDINDACEQLKSGYLSDFKLELKRQFKQRDIQIDEWRTVDKHYDQLYLIGIPDIPLTPQIQFRYCLEYCRREAYLLFGATTQHKGKKGDQLGKNALALTPKYEPLIAAWEDQFPKYARELNPAWPTGCMYLFKDFLQDSYTAKYAANGSPPLKNQVKDVVEEIIRYAEVAKTVWPPKAGLPEMNLRQR